MVTRAAEADALAWRWDGAIAMLGLTAYARVCEQTLSRSERALRRYQSSHVRARIELPDRCAPALASVAMAPLIACGDARDAVDAAAQYLRAAPRNRLNAINHLGDRVWFRHLFPESIWVDSLAMYVLTAARIGRALGDHALESFAFSQIPVFVRALQDPATRLFSHAYLLRSGARVGRGWLRGNGWAAFALCELAEMRPGDATTRTAFFGLMRALVPRRTEDGLWTTMLNRPNSYAESSGSALVAYALAKGARLGLLAPDARAMAYCTLSALCERVSKTRKGVVLRGISSPTIPGPRRYYPWIPTWPNAPYGLGAFLLLAAELASDGS